MLPPHWYQRDNTGSIPGTSGGWAPVQISVYLLVIVPTKKETEWRTCSWIRERHFLWREATSPFLKANYLHSSYFISSFKMGYSYLVIMILSFIQLPPALVNLYISPLYKLPIFFIVLPWWRPSSPRTPPLPVAAKDGEVWPQRPGLTTSPSMAVARRSRCPGPMASPSPAVARG
jgi:hypothetical protein